MRRACARTRREQPVERRGYFFKLSPPRSAAVDHSRRPRQPVVAPRDRAAAQPPARAPTSHAWRPTPPRRRCPRPRLRVAEALVAVRFVRARARARAAACVGAASAFATPTSSRAHAAAAFEQRRPPRRPRRRAAAGGGGAVANARPSCSVARARSAAPLVRARKPLLKRPIFREAQAPRGRRSSRPSSTPSPSYLSRRRRLRELDRRAPGPAGRSSSCMSAPRDAAAHEVGRRRALLRRREARCARPTSRRARLERLEAVGSDSDDQLRKRVEPTRRPRRRCARASSGCRSACPPQRDA